MIEAARALGLAARFALGLSRRAVSHDEERDGAVNPAHGATHAWAQVYLPGAGWIDFDPTSGSVGKAALVTVAVVRDPSHALPLHGTFIGSASGSARHGRACERHLGPPRTRERPSAGKLR